MDLDINALAGRARDDREFAVELYRALCNAEWRHDDGAVWPGGTWRYVGGLVADLRGRGETYFGLLLLRRGGRSHRSSRGSDGRARVGRHRPRARLRMIDPSSGRVEVLGDDGEWVVERLGSAKLPARESELPLGEIDDWGPEEHWEDWAGGPDNQER